MSTAITIAISSHAAPTTNSQPMCTP
jgi:hypothetical protein